MARARERAAERARIETPEGDLLPGSAEVPNLDPLGAASNPNPPRFEEKPAPPPIPERRPSPTPDNRPRATRPAAEPVAPPPVEEKVRKGKKGKVEEPE